MIVCHCHRITDREIQSLARAGAGDVDAVAEACGAGSGCGGCRELIDEILAEAEASPPSVSHSNRRLPVHGSSISV